MPAPTSYPIDEPLIAEVYRLGFTAEEPSLPRHRHDLSREQVETTQRARIILAAAEVVVEQTYAKATTTEIIKAAGVSSKTFYANFAGKEEAFLAGYTLLDGAMLKLAQSPVSTTQPRTDLRRHVRRSLESLAAWPLFARMRFVEGRAAGAEASRRRLEMASSTVDSLVRAIEAARVHDPRIGRPTTGAVAIVSSGISDLATRCVIDEGPAALPELTPTIVEAIERLCFGDPPPFRVGE
ncbi:MAG: TetR/AcrR family transcriptional regulator [Solirubrobacteraceae bacterium]|nr:TetR/AcrR family transcriptional regulator [Solirubrobacteraceae bacterium]